MCFPVLRLRQATFTRQLHIRVIALSNDPGIKDGKQFVMAQYAFVN